MRTLLLQTIIWAVLWGGVCYAGPSVPSLAPPASQDAAHTASNSGGRNKPTGAPQAASPIPNHPGGSGNAPMPDNAVHTPSANPILRAINTLPQARSSKVVAAVKTTVAENKTARLNSLGAKPANAIIPVGPMFKDPRNHGPVTGMLGGPAKNKTAAIISGTGINHKP